MVSKDMQTAKESLACYVYFIYQQAGRPYITIKPEIVTNHDNIIEPGKYVA
jgi:hypothetical protein